VELQVLAAQAVPVVVPPTPTTTPVNAGLRSDTGAEEVAAGSARTSAVAASAGLLFVAGVGSVVVRTRRSPATDGGDQRD
jgi:hypothetical protein